MVVTRANKNPPHLIASAPELEVVYIASHRVLPHMNVLALQLRGAASVFEAEATSHAPDLLEARVTPLVTAKGDGE